MSRPVRTILIIDDDVVIGEYWKKVLQQNEALSVVQCTDSRDVSSILSSSPFDAVILDLNMPYVSGQELLHFFHDNHADVPVIVITAEDKVDTAVGCMKAGAFDFITKPVMGDRLMTIIRHALQIRDLQEKVNQLSGQVLSWDLKHPDSFREILTTTDVMRSIFAHMEAVAHSPRAVLITGESGTGKELIARTIHSISNKRGLFVPVNVAGLDDTLFSDTLFGHAKGAYTGAEFARKGLIEQAAEGTLFLDEIGDLDRGSQIKLLRLLQENEYYPLGVDRPERCRARIITATNADLKKRQEDGSFRKDLYYRLITHHIQLPPLRDRTEDIPVLVRHFAKEAAHQLGRSVPRIPEDLYPVLAAHAFPGNVRELQSLVFDAVSRCAANELSLAFFHEYLRLQNTGVENGRYHGSGYGAADSDRGSAFPSLREIEDHHIGEALRISCGNQSAAARMLKVSQATLSRWLKRRKNNPPG